MCIFNRPVIEVSQTKILVSPTVDDRALVIYENKVKRSGGSGFDDQIRVPSLESLKGPKNAMILPAPLKQEHDIVMVDLSDPESFSFSDCEKCFLTARRVQKEYWQTESSRGARSAFLEVVSVGAYQVSIAKNLEDIKRIDPSVFKVEENIYHLLSSHYRKGFGFVICCFDPNLGVKAHPIAYVCDKEDNGNLFVPCRHEHGGTDHDTAGFYHYFYSVNTNKESGQSVEEREKEWIRYKGKPDWEVTLPEKTPRDLFSHGPLKDIVPIDDIKSFRRKEMWGRYKNDDLHFAPFEVEPVKETISPLYDEPLSEDEELLSDIPPSEKVDLSKLLRPSSLLPSMEDKK